MPSMPALRSLSAFGFFALLGLSSVACGRVRVDDVRGPDATDWKRIQCSHMDKKCFHAAAVMCPNGYYFAKAAGSVPAASDSHVDRDDEVVASGAAVAASGAHPQAGVNAKTLPPQERWGSGMYSRKRGTILVQCAGATAKNDG